MKFKKDVVYKSYKHIWRALEDFPRAEEGYNEKSDSWVKGYLLTTDTYDRFRPDFMWKELSPKISLKWIRLLT